MLCYQLADALLHVLVLALADCLSASPYSFEQIKAVQLHTYIGA